MCDNEFGLANFTNISQLASRAWGEGSQIIHCAVPKLIVPQRDRPPTKIMFVSVVTGVHFMELSSSCSGKEVVLRRDRVQSHI